MKCWNSTFNAQGSSEIIKVCTGSSNENICSSSEGAQEKGKTGWNAVYQSPLLKLNTIIYVCIFVPSQMGDIESISNSAQYVTLDSKIKCLSS